MAEQEQEQELCRDYGNGRCRFGTACRRLHEPVGIPQTPVEKVDEVCRKFRNTGSCRFGDGCRFMHTEGEPIESPPKVCSACSESLSPESFTRREWAKNDAERTCRECGGGEREEGSGNRRGPSAKVCTACDTDVDKDGFSNNQWRKRGEDVARTCKDCQEKGLGPPRRQRQRADNDDEEGYQEGDEGGEGQPRRRARRNNARGPRPLQSFIDNKLDEDCNNYKEGRCRYGEYCRRRHFPVGIPQEAVEKKTDEVCRNFQVDACRFGDMCRFVHQAGEGNGTFVEE